MLICPEDVIDLTLSDSEAAPTPNAPRPLSPAGLANRISIGDEVIDEKPLVEVQSTDGFELLDAGLSAKRPHEGGPIASVKRFKKSSARKSTQHITDGQS